MAFSAISTVFGPLNLDGLRHPKKIENKTISRRKGPTFSITCPNQKTNQRIQITGPNPRKVLQGIKMFR